ncbi:MAG TPA: hypothetical protein PK514_07030 [Spirochaetota bacterium]|nr:hypothetical protein [Spirochaetota bacterium]
MRELITEAVLPVINENGISSERLIHLIFLRNFINRISSRNYLNDEDLEKIYEKYGVLPHVVSWGDFFQAELATTLRTASDDEFFKAYEAVKFDMISSYKIFKDKGLEFFNWVDNSYSWIAAKDQALCTEEDKEILHLKVLMDYFLELGINGEFTDVELYWHSSFKEAVAI